MRKVQSIDKSTLTDTMYNQNKFNLEELYQDYPNLKTIISSSGKEKRMTSSCISYGCFTTERVSDDDIKVIGVENNKRIHKFINKKYVDCQHENLDKYKVILPANNGSGALGEVIPTPLIGEPLIGFTQTFISIGAFDSLSESENAMKYIKSKFSRVMLGILKITQNGKRDTWKYVPLQDFTDNSDIDWNVSIADIDKQLYKKYGLTREEIDFVETHVKEMA